MLGFLFVTQRFTRLGSEIRAARNKKGWSLDKLGEALGCTRQRIILWEQGEHRPRQVYRDLLTDHLETEFDWTADVAPMNERESEADDRAQHRWEERQVA